jgi:glycerol dehydrogenase-like iron-containing ADH family enzyme
MAKCVIAHAIPTALRKRDKNMSSNDRKATDAALRELFKAMNPHRAQEIREAYYKAVEGLMTLSEALEIADSRQPQTAGPLLDEHFIACEALDAINKSRLGAIL